MVNIKNRFFRWLKILGVPCGLVMVITVFTQKYADSASALWTLGLIPGLVLNQAAFFMYAERLHYLLNIRNIATSRLNAARIFFQSLFYAVIVPLSIGAEISRYVKLGGLHDGEKKGERFSVILVDRLWSLTATVAAVVLTAPFVLDFTEQHWETALVLLAAVLFIVGVGWRFMDKSRHGASLKKEVQWYINSHKSITYTGTLSIMAHFAACTSVYFVAWALGMEISWAQTIFTVSVGMLFLVVPVSVFGAGATELASGIVYVQQGLSVESAVILAAITYAYRLVGAIQGGIWEVSEAAARGQASAT